MAKELEQHLHSTAINTMAASPHGDEELSPVNQSVELTADGAHVQQLEKNFGLLSICSVGIVTGNTWVSFGGAVVSYFSLTKHGPCLHEQG